MQTLHDSTTSGTDPIRAIRRYPLVVLVFTAAFGLLGALYGSSRPPTFVATSGLVVEEARASSLFDNRSGDPERYVADQVAILQSVVVAERASALAPKLEPPAEIRAQDFGGNLTITPSAERNFIEISFRADDALTAFTGANAIGASYEEIIGATIAADAESAISRLDDAIDATVAEIVTLQAQVEAERSDNDERVELDQQLAEIVSELVELRIQASTDPISDDPAAELEAIQTVTARANQLTAELNARLLVSDVEARLPATAVLLRRQQDAAALLTELTLQRSQIEVDAQVAGNGVAFFAPAGPGRREGISAESVVLVSAVLGALIGSGLAYWLNQRRQRVEHKLAPWSILRVPLLVDLPGLPSQLPIPAIVGGFFGRDRNRRNTGLLPVLEDPTSAQANAFRILAGGLQRQLRERHVDSTEVSASAWAHQGETTDSARDGRGGLVVACVSPMSRDANAFVAVNVALAAAKAGLSVMLVDGDIVGQDVSRMIDRIQLGHRTMGLVNVLRGTATLDDAVEHVQLGDGNDLAVLEVGGDPDTLPDLLGLPVVAPIVRELAHEYDLVVIGFPPILEAAHATAMQQADRALVVVPHGTGVGHLTEVRHRMDTIGLAMVGYVYMGPVKRGGKRSRRPPAFETIRTDLRYDDLTRIEGIGPWVQELLYEEGITTMAQLAATTPARLREILESAGRWADAIHDPADWPHQASIGVFKDEASEGAIPPSHQSSTTGRED